MNSFIKELSNIFTGAFGLHKPHNKYILALNMIPKFVWNFKLITEKVITSLETMSTAVNLNRYNNNIVNFCNILFWRTDEWRLSSTNCSVSEFYPSSLFSVLFQCPGICLNIIKMSENHLKIKRQRGKNFSDREKDLLIDLIFPFKSIIESIKVSKVFFINYNILFNL